MKDNQLCQVCGENRAVFAFQEPGLPTRHVCTVCHQESLPEPARSVMKAMTAGPCRYCGKPGHAFDASQGMVFRFPFEKDYLCGACQTDLIRVMGESMMQLKAAKPHIGEEETLKAMEEAGRQADLEMRRNTVGNQGGLSGKSPP